MGRASETSDEKAEASNHVFIAVKDVDTAAELVSGDQGVLDIEESLRVRCVTLEFLFFFSSFDTCKSTICRRKIDKHILPLMCSKSSF